MNELHRRVVSPHCHQKGFGESGGDEIVGVGAKDRTHTKHRDRTIRCAVSVIGQQRLGFGFILGVLKPFDGADWRFFCKKIRVVGVSAIHGCAAEVAYLFHVGVGASVEQVDGPLNVDPPGGATVVAWIHDIRKVDNRLDTMLPKQVWKWLAYV